jgi:hypothetical protein
LVFGLVSALFILPYWNGVKLSLEFQSAREPSGLTILGFHHILGYLGANLATLLQLRFVILPAVAAFLLVTGMSLIYAYLAKKDLPLRQKLLMIFLVYTICAKNFHEPHILILIPFFILELHERYSFDKKLQYRLLWILPAIYAVVGVPLVRFLYGYIDPNVLRLFEPQALPQSIALAQGIVLSAVVVLFYLVLWNALITLIRGRPVVSLEGLHQRLKR